MKTKKQEELLNTYLSAFDDDTASLYKEIALYLSGLGYNPKKVKSGISFKHDLHNKQMAKMGVKVNRKTGTTPFFSLRFSACRDYSQRFAEIVGEFAAKYPARTAGCVTGGCNYCGGGAGTHVYTHKLPNGETGYHCGAYAIEIPDITPGDIAEIKKLIKEEHEYLLANETGV